MKDTSGIAWTGLVLTVVGALAALWAAGELQGGVPDLLRHWWSTLAILLLLLGLAVTAIGIARLTGPIE